MIAKPTAPAAARPRRGARLVRLLAILVPAVLVLRSFVLAPFIIPSDSMLPTLERGDYLVASKWPYGWSRWSLPFDAPLWDGTIAPRLPQRGDIAVFRHPITHGDYVKRVIGLPGDTVALTGGQVVLNGVPVPRMRVGDYLAAPLRAGGCVWRTHEMPGGAGASACRYPRFAEALPGSGRHQVLDLGASVQDRFGPLRIPAGHVFVLGDNRDNSQDSRFPPRAGGGVGLVPAGLLVARVERVVFSTASWPAWLTGIEGA